MYGRRKAHPMFPLDTIWPVADSELMFWEITFCSTESLELNQVSTSNCVPRSIKSKGMSYVYSTLLRKPVCNLLDEKTILTSINGVFQMCQKSYYHWYTQVHYIGNDIFFKVLIMFKMYFYYSLCVTFDYAVQSNVPWHCTLAH